MNQFYTIFILFQTLIINDNILRQNHKLKQLDDNQKHYDFKNRFTNIISMKPTHIKNIDESFRFNANNVSSDQKGEGIFLEMTNIICIVSNIYLIVSYIQNKNQWNRTPLLQTFWLILILNMIFQANSLVQRSINHLNIPSQLIKMQSVVINFIFVFCSQAQAIKSFRSYKFMISGEYNQEDQEARLKSDMLVNFLVCCVQVVIMEKSNIEISFNNMNSYNQKLGPIQCSVIIIPILLSQVIGGIYCFNTINQAGRIKSNSLYKQEHITLKNHVYNSTGLNFFSHISLWTLSGAAALAGFSDGADYWEAKTLFIYYMWFQLIPVAHLILQLSNQSLKIDEVFIGTNYRKFKGNHETIKMNKGEQQN